MDPQLVTRIVEAALLASHQPLTIAQLEALFTVDEPAPDGSIRAALDALRQDCEGRGVELVEVASGWRFQVKADVHPWVARLWTERQTRYTRATLETLALIAYRQPITRGEIEQVRGVATNSNIIKALEEREWIRVVGHRDMPGRPELLGTTKAFLDYFGLKRLDDLPPLSELKDFGELEPQLDFEGEARAVGDVALAGDAGGASRVGNDAAEADHGRDADAGADGGSDGTDGNDAPGYGGDAAPRAQAHDEGDAVTGEATPSAGDRHDMSAATPADAQDNETTALADDGDGTRSNA